MTHNQWYENETDWMARVALGTSRLDDVLLMFEVKRVEARRKGRFRRWLGRLFR